MLTDLVVVNGSMTPEFNKDTLEYKVDVDKNAVSLILDYKIKDATITIYGNDYLTDGENHVLVEIYDNSKVITYTLVVNKEKTDSVAKTLDNVEKVEVNAKNEFLSDLITPGISVICFITICALFCIIFKRK